MVREFGKQDLFITFTCNPKWEEITDNDAEYQKVENPPDLINSVFRLKCKELIKDIVDKQIFGMTLLIFIQSSSRSAVYHTCIFF